MDEFGSVFGFKAKGVNSVSGFRWSDSNNTDFNCAFFQNIFQNMEPNLLRFFVWVIYWSSHSSCRASFLLVLLANCKSHSARLVLDMKNNLGKTCGCFNVLQNLMQPTFSFPSLNLWYSLCCHDMFAVTWVYLLHSHKECVAVLIELYKKNVTVSCVGSDLLFELSNGLRLWITDTFVNNIYRYHDIDLNIARLVSITKANVDYIQVAIALCDTTLMTMTTSLPQVSILIVSIHAHFSKMHQEAPHTGASHQEHPSLAESQKSILE